MIDSTCVIVRRPPGEEASSLGIRTAYATLMSAIDTKTLFIDDGIYNLLSDKGYNADMLREIIGAEGDVYCTRESMKVRGFSEEDLVEGVNMISEEEVARIIEECESVAMF